MCVTTQQAVERGGDVISKLEYVGLREVWRHEAKDFTGWLAENIDFINEALQIDLTVLETEKQIGAFNVDIYCEDGQGASAVIENQLERTDHTHLGQLLTYAVGVDAKTIIWVSPDPRPEHVKVIEWLNETTPADVGWYIVRVQAVRIDNSPIAPLFTMAAGPDPDAKGIGTAKKDLADRHIKRLEFWSGLLDVINQKTNLFSRVNPSKDNWLAAGSGVGRVYYQLVVRMTDVSLQIVIDRDPEGPLNKKIFDCLHEQKADIEAKFGNEINWRRMDDKISSRIQYDIAECGLKEEKSWKDGYKVIADKLVKWEKAFQPHINDLNNKGLW